MINVPFFEEVEDNEEDKELPNSHVLVEAVITLTLGL